MSAHNVLGQTANLTGPPPVPLPKCLTKRADPVPQMTGAGDLKTLPSPTRVLHGHLPTRPQRLRRRAWAPRAALGARRHRCGAAARRRVDGGAAAAEEEQDKPSAQEDQQP